MDKDWLRNGIGLSGFKWHGPADVASRPAIVDPQQKLKQIWFLERALAASQSVARVVFPSNSGYATCFLIGPRLIMTNNHVFGTTVDAQGVQIQFGYRQLFNGDITKPTCIVGCDPTIFVTDPVLDFSVVGLDAEPPVPFLTLDPDLTVQPGSHVSIIQHPGGDPLQVAMRDNSLVYDDDNLVQYLTNTEYGSSGSPVFNDNWQVIALHSQRVADPSVPGGQAWYRNQGSKIAAILKNKKVEMLVPVV